MRRQPQTARALRLARLAPALPARPACRIVRVWRSRRAMTDLCFMTARELRAALGRREVSAREVVQAHLDQIGRVNPDVNAIVTLVAEQAMAQARGGGRASGNGRGPAPAARPPGGHKDLHDTAGIRTTYGSPLYADHVPARTTWSSSGCGGPGRSPSARPTCLSSGRARIRSTRSSAPPATLTT